MSSSQQAALERAAGNVFGLEEPRIPLELGAGLAPLEALEKAIEPALEKPPCVISFSGGRDSSCMLATATRLARREGFELPVPVSVRFPGAASADETSWQELVISDLGLPDWEKAEVADGDLLGAAATTVLRRHGPVWPGNAFIVDSVLRACKGGGSFLTGLGGDEIFGTWRWRSIGDALGRRRPPQLRDPLRMAYMSLPARARVPRERRRVSERAPDWLRPGAREQAIELMAELAADEPAWWQNRIRWRARRRNLLVQLETHKLLAADVGMTAAAPIIDPVFVAALARAGGRFGFGDRTDSMLAAFRDAVPESLLRRSTKATGGDLFWVGESRRFATNWDGSGVDHELVDPEALRRQWLSRYPDGRTAVLLQAAWLHADDGGTGVQ